MRGIASAQVSRGAQTCILVGELDGVDDLDLGGCAHVLWFARRRGPLPGRFRAGSRAVAVETLEQFEPARAGAVLDQFIGRDALRMPSVYLTEDVTDDSSPSFLPVIESVLAQCELHHRARTFRQQHGFSGQKHVLANLPTYVRRRLPRSWAGALDGVPAFVCGAGPSLDASVAPLAAAAHHGVVFAADSALRALGRHGVSVDFAVSVDALKTPQNCLPPGTPLPARLVLANRANPAWLQAVPEDRLYFLSGRELTEDALAQTGVAKTTAEVSENCGITAIELAVYLGCRPICLFGMDHAVDSQDPTRWHSRDLTESLQQQMPLPPEKNYPKVPGNYQAEIATPLLREWRFLDRRCAALPAGLVHNVIDRGARLQNATLVHPRDFSVDPAGPDKTSALHRLPAPGPTAGCGWPDVCATLRRDAAVAGRIVTDALAELRAGRQRRAVQRLYPLFQDARFGVIFGNYSLKLLPHLVCSADAQPPLWQELLNECLALCTLARTAG